MLLKRGQLVTISGAAGKVKGHVVHVETPDKLPVVNSRDELARVKAIMAERRIVQLAMIEHKHHGAANLTSGGKPVKLGEGSRTVIFAALLNSAGEWHDLEGQRLTITIRSNPRHD